MNENNLWQTGERSKSEPIERKNLPSIRTSSIVKIEPKLLRENLLGDFNRDYLLIESISRPISFPIKNITEDYFELEENEEKKPIDYKYDYFEDTQNPWPEEQYGNEDNGYYNSNSLSEDYLNNFGTNNDGFSNEYNYQEKNSAFTDEKIDSGYCNFDDENKGENNNFHVENERNEKDERNENTEFDEMQDNSVVREKGTEKDDSTYPNKDNWELEKNEEGADGIHHGQIFDKTNVTNNINDNNTNNNYKNDNEAKKTKRKKRDIEFADPDAMKRDNEPYNQKDRDKNHYNDRDENNNKEHHKGQKRERDPYDNVNDNDIEREGNNNKRNNDGYNNDAYNSDGYNNDGYNNAGNNNNGYNGDGYNNGDRGYGNNYGGNSRSIYTDFGDFVDPGNLKYVVRKISADFPPKIRQAIEVAGIDPIDISRLAVQVPDHARAVKHAEKVIAGIERDRVFEKFIVQNPYLEKHTYVDFQKLAIRRMELENFFFAQRRDNAQSSNMKKFFFKRGNANLNTGIFSNIQMKDDSLAKLDELEKIYQYDLAREFKKINLHHMRNRITRIGIKTVRFIGNALLLFLPGKRFENEKTQNVIKIVLNSSGIAKTVAEKSEIFMELYEYRWKAKNYKIQTPDNSDLPLADLYDPRKIKRRLCALIRKNTNLLAQSSNWLVAEDYLNDPRGRRVAQLLKACFCEPSQIREKILRGIDIRTEIEHNMKRVYRLR